MRFYKFDIVLMIFITLLRLLQCMNNRLVTIQMKKKEIKVKEEIEEIVCYIVEDYIVT